MYAIVAGIEYNLYDEYKSSGIEILLVLSFLACCVIFFAGWGNIRQVSQSVPMQTFNASQKEKAPFPVIDTKHETPIVNVSTTVLNEVNNNLNKVPHSNVYDVNSNRVQLLGKKAVYISDLDFTGNIFNYNSNGKQTPGYFITDATSKNAKPQFIKQKMFYTPNAYLSKDADRLIYEHTPFGYKNTGLQLEVDDNKHPYYVSTLVKTNFLFNEDYSHTKIAVIDAITGEVKIYNQHNLPSFIDVGVNSITAVNELQTWGKYHNGFINTTFLGGKKGIVTGTSSGVIGDNRLTPIVYDGKLYYYSSLSSEKSNQKSILGHAFINARTGKILKYTENDNLMTGTRAKSIAENQMRQTKWIANNPLLYMIDGQPTWIVSMLDPDNHVFMKYVYINAADNGDSNSVATGSNSDETLNSYRNLLKNNITATSSSNKKETKTITGTVSRIGLPLSQSKVTFMLNNDKHIYTVDVSNFPVAQVLQKGDKLSFKAQIISGSTAGTVQSNFKNNSLN